MEPLMWTHPSRDNPDKTLPALGQQCLVMFDSEDKDDTVVEATFVLSEFSPTGQSHELVPVWECPLLNSYLLIEDVKYWIPNPFVLESGHRPCSIVPLYPSDDLGELSDGYHTFNSLYEQRMYLTAALVKAHKYKCWKSRRHSDGKECFGGGWFIVGFNTPEGPYTYHYQIAYWDMFDCPELAEAPAWDGHTEKDVARLLSL